MFTEGLSLLLSAIAVYFAISIKVFNSVYDTSHVIIDELFHIPQGMQYCESNFTHWDPKITTLPGLYIVSYLFVKPLLGCSVYALRFTNLAASCINIYIFASMIKSYQNSARYDFKIILQALNIAILPPLYFFSHVYYTDTLSLTFALMFIRIYMLKERYILLTILGIFSIIMRQTNVVWIALCLGNTILDLFMNSYMVKKNEAKEKKNQLNSQYVRVQSDAYIYGVRDGMEAVIFHFQTRFVWIKNDINYDIVTKLTSMFTLLIGFLIFVIVNGSIVVGDKSAHTASIHMPQLLYFTLFYGIFSFPYILGNLKCVLTKLLRYKISVLLLILFCLIVVHYNTLIHPYLLADNRHYTFYIWNKFFGKYEYAKYVITPLYVFFLFSLLNNLTPTTNFGFILPYFICLFPALALQKMIEVRYFFIPYVLLKTRFCKTNWSILFVDLLINLLINYMTLKIFFTKKIIWNDFPDVQRLIW